jgi:hypothetical protein
VRTFNVVGEDFQLRLRVDRRFVRKQNVVVLLERIGFLRFFLDVDLAVENAGCAVVENSIVILVPLAVRRCMVDQCVMVYVLFAFDDRDAF